jgi:hypothetical protein
MAPKLAVGDGAMGFWAAMAEVFPTMRAQRMENPWASYRYVD